MPRDDAGIFVHRFTFTQDEENRVPFSPERFDARFEDVASGLNDIPRQVPPGTDPNMVRPGAIMQEDGVVYIAVVNGDSGFMIWRDITSVGLTDASDLANIDTLNDAIAALVDGAPPGLDTLNEIAAALDDDPQFARNNRIQLDLKAGINHTHTLGDIAGLRAALSRLASESSAGSSRTWSDWFIADSTIDLGDVVDMNGGSFSDEDTITDIICLNEGAGTFDLGDLT